MVLIWFLNYIGDFSFSLTSKWICLDTETLPARLRRQVIQEFRRGILSSDAGSVFVQHRRLFKEFEPEFPLEQQWPQDSIYVFYIKGYCESSDAKEFRLLDEDKKLILSGQFSRQKNVSNWRKEGF